MAACGIKLIKMGKHNVPFQKVVDALKASEKYTNSEEAIIKGYALLPDSVSMAAWSSWFKRIHDVSKGGNITQQDLVGYNGNQKAQRLANLLNFEGFVDNVKGEITYRLLPETVHAINSIKKQLITKGESLNEQQIAKLITTIESALFVSKSTQENNVLRQKAKKNLSKKFGSARELFPLLKKFLSLEHSGIPQDLRQEYNEVLTQLAEREAIPDIKAIGEQVNKIKNILEKADAPKVYKNVKQDDPKEHATRMSRILSMQVDTSKLELREERDAAEILKSLTVEDLSFLNNRQLAHLQAALININNGFMPHAGYNLILDIDANRVAGLLSNLADNAKSYGSWAQKLYGKAKAATNDNFNEVAEMIRSSPATVVDEIFGNQGKQIFYETFRRLGVAQERASVESKAIDARQEKLHNMLVKKFGRGDKMVETVFKLKLIEKQQEYEANPGQYSAKQYVDSIIAQVDSGKQATYTQRDAQILENLVEKYTNEKGEFDLKKLRQGLSKVENAVLKSNKELSIEMGDKLIFTAGVIRGERVDVLQDYSHSHVLGEQGEKDSKDYENRFFDGSAKAKSVQERTEAGEKAPIISLDVLGDAGRSAKQIVLDYYMTPQIRVVNRALNRAQQRAKKPEAKIALEGLITSVDEAIKRDLSKTFESYSLTEAVAKKIVRNFYITQLASIQRAAAELVSNTAFATFVAPTQALTGAKALTSQKLYQDGATILNNLGSFQTGKLFEKGSLGGKTVETSFFSEKRQKRIKAQSGTQQLIQTVSDHGNKLASVPIKVSSKILTTPDRIIAQPIWFGEFIQQFKKETGQEPDFNKIKENDEAYMTKHREILKKSTQKADDISALAGASTNSYVGISKIKIGANDSAAKKAYKITSGYLMTFMIWEASTFRTGVLSAMGKGVYSRKQGAAILAGTSARYSLYFPMVQMLNKMVANLIFGDDEEETDYYELFKFELLGSLMTLLTQGRLSAHPRAVISLATEYFNEEYLEGLRDGKDYDPYKHSLTFNLISNSAFRYNGFLSLIAKFLGPLAKPAREVSHLWNKGVSASQTKIRRKKEQKKEELYIDAAIAASGWLGLNPFARETKKIYRAYKENK